jgi:hypothetical protein
VSEFLQIPEIVESQASKYLTHNSGVRRLRVLAQLAVAGRDLTAPPSSPTAGDMYIVGPSATGDWSGHDNEIACWTGSAWDYMTPDVGWIAVAVDESALLMFSGTTWSPYVPEQTVDISGWSPGIPSDGTTLLMYAVGRSMTLPTGLTDSRVAAGTAATASAVLSIKKNGTEIGTATFAASGTSATLAATSATTLSSGDMITVVAPATEDATLADIAITLAAVI